MPQLKSFLKDGEAESYRNVEVKFIHGRKAIMTLWETGDIGVDGDREKWEELEKITLSDYKTKASVTVSVHVSMMLCSHIKTTLYTL